MQIVKQRVLSVPPAELPDRWLLGRLVAVTLKVGITFLPHKTAKVRLAEL